MVKARQYPWGVVQGNDGATCLFPRNPDQNDSYCVGCAFIFCLGLNCLLFSSGKRAALWLCEAEGDAHLCQYGGFTWADPLQALRTLQALQTGRNGIQGHRPRVQTSEVSCLSTNTCLHPKYQTCEGTRTSVCCVQFAADLRGQASGIPAGAAEERRWDEADFCAEGEGKGSRA